MTSQVQNLNKERKYDLKERTSNFGEAVIEFVKDLQKNPINLPLISQLVRAGTSVGANYMEADGAESKKDFQHKIGICKKEAKETSYWFQMVAKANYDKAENCRKLWKEAHELTLIFSSIINKTRNKI
jgi:four helix bundle protein